LGVEKRNEPHGLDHLLMNRKEGHSGRPEILSIDCRLAVADHLRHNPACIQIKPRTHCLNTHRQICAVELGSGSLLRPSVPGEASHDDPNVQKKFGIEGNSVTAIFTKV
jgi:hypothetical protein